jgi:hypothetical protein
VETSDLQLGHFVSNAVGSANERGLNVGSGGFGGSLTPDSVLHKDDGWLRTGTSIASLQFGHSINWLANFSCVSIV